MAARQSVTVVIPTLNEEGNLVRLLPLVTALPEVAEVIVSDGGSRDGTCTAARRFPKTRVIVGPRGRGRQLNRAARVAHASALWFVHADCLLVGNPLPQMLRVLKRPGVAAVTLSLKLTPARLAYRLIETGVWFRCRCFQRPYGDQSLLVAARTFWAAGGFPECHAMEDLYLVHRLSALGRVITLKHPLLVSARRWQHYGLLRTTAYHWGLIVQDWLVGPPAVLPTEEQ